MPRKRIKTLKVVTTKVIYKGKKKPIYKLENVKTFVPYVGMKIKKSETVIIT